MSNRKYIGFKIGRIVFEFWNDWKREDSFVPLIIEIRLGEMFIFDIGLFGLGFIIHTH